MRLHSECFTGDLLGSLRCDCGDQLRGAIAEIARAPAAAVLLYLAQEGRGIGLVNKLRAYNLQDAGLDTFDANEQLGFDADERVYLPAAEMLRQLGFTRVRLMTNNPDKVAALTRCGIAVVERVPHVFPTERHNERYLHAKARARSSSLSLPGRFCRARRHGREKPPIYGAFCLASGLLNLFAMTDAAVATATSAAPPPAVHANAWHNADGFGFRDVLDIINPLQHLPIISSIYRWATGDSSTTVGTPQVASADGKPATQAPMPAWMASAGTPDGQPRTPCRQ